MFTLSPGMLVRGFFARRSTYHENPWRPTFRCSQWNHSARKISSALMPSMESNGVDYSSWSNEQLVERVTRLEQQLREANEQYAGPVLQRFHALITFADIIYRPPRSHHNHCLPVIGQKTLVLCVRLIPESTPHA